MARRQTGQKLYCRRPANFHKFLFECPLHLAMDLFRLIGARRKDQDHRPTMIDGADDRSGPVGTGCDIARSDPAANPGALQSRAGCIGGRFVLMRMADENVKRHDADYLNPPFSLSMVVSNHNSSFISLPAGQTDRLGQFLPNAAVRSMSASPPRVTAVADATAIRRGRRALPPCPSARFPTSRRRPAPAPAACRSG
jgi:hypothetical protein